MAGQILGSRFAGYRTQVTRIGLIAPVLRPVPPHASGGIEAFIDVFGRGLQIAGLDVTVATTGNATTTLPTISLLPEDEIRAQGNVPREFLHVRFAYEQFGDCDAVVDFTAIGPLIDQSTTKRVAYIAGGLGDSVQEQARQMVYHECDPDIALFTSSAICRDGHPSYKRAHVVHTGIDPDDCDIHQSREHLLFVGTLHETCGLTELIPTLNQLDIPTKIIGKAAGHTYLDTLQSQCADHVTYEGELDADIVDNYLARATGLLVPNPAEEPTAILLLRALSHGTPLLTRRAPFISEYFSEFPEDVIVYFDTADQLGNAVEVAQAASPESGRHGVVTHHPAATMANQFLDRVL